MALAKMNDLLEYAKSNQKGCGSFSVGNMEMIIGAVKAAEDSNTPIILQIAEVRLKHSPLELIGAMMLEAAKNAKVDIAVHLDHGLTLHTIRKALDMGFTSVMFDGSALLFEQNIQKTKEVVSLAKKFDATVEAELGLVGGSEDGSHDNGILYTNPEQAKLFCEKTNINALAVAIGNAHGNYTAAPKLAFDVLAEIEKNVPIPLVLHGGSGITDEDFQKAISLGIRKVNIATASFNALVKETEEYINTPQKHNYFSLNEAMIEGVYKNVKRHIEIFQCHQS